MGGRRPRGARVRQASAALILTVLLSTTGLHAGIASTTGCYSSMAAGSFFGMGLESDGTVATWGRNFYGSLGYGGIWTGGPLPSPMAPAKVPGVSGITAIAAGQGHALALQSDGTVLAWGSNIAGQLGNGSYGWGIPGFASSATPTPVMNLSNVTQVAAGGVVSMAIKSDGSLWVWGDNTVGQIGNGTSGNGYTSNLAFVTSPSQVVGPGGTGYLDSVVAAAAGGAFSLALRSDGTVWAWGLSPSLGVAGITDPIVPSPIQVVGLPPITQIAAGHYHGVALDTNGQVWTWGFIAGANPPIQSDTPTLVSGLSNVVQVTAGLSFALALKSDGTVWGWGFDYDGELLDPTLAVHPTPIQLAGLSNVVKIFGGDYGAFAIESDGSVWGWGGNGDGQLGVNLPAGYTATPVSLGCATTYGGGPGSGGQTQVAVTVAAPTISVRGWTYSPNPFDITATAQDVGPSAIQGLQLSIALPDGLKLATGETSLHTIAPVSAGSSATTSWKVVASPQTAGDATLSYTVTATAANAPTASATGSVTIPMVRPRYVAFGDSLTTGYSVDCDAIADYSASPWGCPSNPTPDVYPRGTTPYPDRVAAAYGFSSSDNAADYSPTKNRPGFPNKDLDRVGIWGYSMAQAQVDYNNPPNAVGQWMPQLKQVELAQDLVTGSLGINDMQFSDVASWYQTWSKDYDLCLHQPNYPCGALVKIRAQHLLDVMNQVPSGAGVSPMDQLYLSLSQAKSNGARVVVVPMYNPYPNTTDCRPLFEISDTITGTLNRELVNRATANNLLVAANVKTYFAGHEAGTTNSYVWGDMCDPFAALQAYFSPVHPNCSKLYLCLPNFGGWTAVQSHFDPHPNDQGAQAIAKAILDVAPPPSSGAGP